VRRVKTVTLPATILIVVLAAVGGAGVALATRGHPSGPHGHKLVAASCNPNYSGYCVPNVSYDIDCADIGHHTVRVVGTDEYGFDADGDGIGCEPYP
jgi:hypothetical protein